MQRHRLRPRRPPLLNLFTTGALIVVALPAAAQTHATWTMGTTAMLSSFRGAATPAVAGDVAVRPDQGVAIGIGISRRWGPWAVSFYVNHLTSHVEAISDDIAVQDRAQDLNRLRLAPMLARRISQPGNGVLEFRIGPTLDGWTIGTSHPRGTIGGEAQLVLALPAGSVSLENLFGVGWSTSPFRAGELPDGYRRTGLRTLTAGIGLRFAL